MKTYRLPELFPKPEVAKWYAHISPESVYVVDAEYISQEQLIEKYIYAKFLNFISV